MKNWTVVIPSDITAEQAQQTVTITMPNTTVTVKSADGNVLFIKEMAASTAPNTLVVDKDVKIGELTVTKGSVQVFGEIGKLIHAAGEGVVINIYIMESGRITTPPDSNKFNVLFQTQGGGHSTTAGGNGFENGGIFFKTSNDSRASIELGNQAEDGESFDWKEGDKFTLIEKIVDDSQPGVTVTPKVHEFTISDSYSNDSPSGGADFTSPTALTYLSKFVAFYPVVKEDESGYNFYLNNTLKDNSAESWNNYFKNNMFMKATGNSVPSDQMGLNFQQMCSLIRITYTNATNAARNIKRISVDGSWGSGFHVDKNSLEPMACSGEEDYGVTFTDGATIGVDETVDFYILYFPYRDYNEVTSENELSQMKKVSIETFDGHKLYTPDYLFDEDKTPDFLRGTGKRFWFSVTETADGLKWTDSLNEEPGGDEPETGSVIITNNVLAEALWTEYSGQYQMSCLENGSVEMTREVANSISRLEFDSDKYTFTTLEGIENFKNLETLICYNQNIASIDLSQNTALTELNIQNWKSLTSLDLSNNTLLERLSVTYSQIAELDLQKNTKLTQLTLYNNEQLKTVKISTSCTTLEHLDLSGAKMLETLSVPNPEKVYYLHYNDTQLSFDLSNFTGLISLDCSGKPNDFAELSTEAKAKLERLHCKNCNLTLLGLTGYTALKHLNCANNQLASLDLKNLSLESLVVDYNRLTKIDLTNSKATLQEFYCNNNQLESLNLKDFAALRHLSANTNVLVSMDVTDCSQLLTVQCGWNKLTELDLRASKSINYLICGSQNNQEPLVLKLDASLHNRWYNEWLKEAKKGENDNVTLWTGVDAGSGNTGANDFPIGGNY